VDVDEDVMWMGRGLGIGLSLEVVLKLGESIGWSCRSASAKEAEK